MSTCYCYRPAHQRTTRAPHAPRPSFPAYSLSLPPSPQPAVDDVEELRSRLLITLEDAPDAACDCRRPHLLHPAHDHAEVAALDDHRHAQGPQRLLQRVRDLPRQALLHLQPPGEDVGDARDFGQPDDCVRIGSAGGGVLGAGGRQTDRGEHKK